VAYDGAYDGTYKIPRGKGNIRIFETGVRGFGRSIVSLYIDYFAHLLNQEYILIISKFLLVTGDVCVDVLGSSSHFNLSR